MRTQEIQTSPLGHNQNLSSMHHNRNGRYRGNRRGRGRGRFRDNKGNYHILLNQEILVEFPFIQDLVMTMYR